MKDALISHPKWSEILCKTSDSPGGAIKDAVGRWEEYNRRPKVKNLNTEITLWIQE